MQPLYARPSAAPPLLVSNASVIPLTLLSPSFLSPFFTLLQPLWAPLFLCLGRVFHVFTQYSLFSFLILFTT